MARPSDPSPARLGPVLAVFDFAGSVEDVRSYGSGYINDSFAVRVSRPGKTDQRFILQRINTHVFADPAGLMANIVGVTAHVRAKIESAGGDPDRQTLTVVPTRDGAWFHQGPDGSVWRVYRFVEDMVCYQSAETPAVFAAAARAFGQFTHWLDDYPVASLHETIPSFHDTRVRYRELETAVAADAVRRVARCGAEIDFVRARAGECGRLMDLLDAGELPLRVAHNDTKLNNVLLDPVRQVACVIDLDTVMPGLAVHDFGDAIRFGASTAGEDETDLRRVRLSLELFEAYTAGYLATAGAGLTRAETDNLVWGAKLITLELGMRFLTDFLQGDTYFAITRPGQNLDRCRTQFALVAQIEADFSAMSEIVRRYTVT